MWFLLALVFVAAYLLIPKMPTQGMEAGKFEAPIAKEGVPVGVLAGTRNIKGPHVVWYGDVKAVAIKKSGGKK